MKRHDKATKLHSAAKTSLKTATAVLRSTQTNLDNKQNDYYSGIPIIQGDYFSKANCF